jgi:hypothetical protein
MSAATWIERVGRMDRAEIVFRARTAARAQAQFFTTAWRPSGWRREALASLLVPSAGALGTALERVEARDWAGAHHALSEHFHRRVSRFLVSPHALPDLAATIRARFPRAAEHAAARADAAAAGRFDLLGYRDLDCRAPDGAVDWHADPVHGRRAPRAWWSRVPYLGPSIGDHKIIWELNRHQHFLALGRAAWLAGDAGYRDAFVRQLEAWLAANPPLTGINWSSMLELSLRSLSWLWALHFFVEAPAARGPAGRRRDGAAPPDAEAPWLVDLLVGLDRQLSHVAANLSRYFSPNTHLTGEALGLYVCGRALPELRSASDWVTLGRDVLLDQASRQVAADGGHVERSTHYQRYTLDFYLLALSIARATDDPCADAFAEVVDRLASATRLLADPAGRLPHVGDDDGGSLFPICGRAVDDVKDSLGAAALLLGRKDLAVDAAPEETLWLLDGQPPWILKRRRSPARSAPPGSSCLPETGYFVSRPGPRDHILVDGGPHGYLNAGHAHADALALTATLSGRRLFIDPGTATYTMSAEVRDRFRSSRMHNTLTLDDRSQSIPAGPFHWRTTANARVDRWLTGDALDYFEGTQDGYRPLRHRRRVVIVPGGPNLVVDSVDGDTARHTAEVLWHLDPAWSVEVGDGAIVLLRHDSGARAWLAACGARVEVLIGDGDGVGWHSPVYGRVEPSPTLRLVADAVPPFHVVTVFAEGAAAYARTVTRVPAAPSVSGTALALRVASDRVADLLVFGTPGERVAAEGIETDARMLCVRMRADGKPARVAMLDGTYVRMTEDGTPLVPPERGGEGLVEA